jgi:DNA polymerase I-like protein with 3'-5' exonuclease and polymerase domains
MTCDNCKIKDKCNKLFYIGNINNPKIAFIMPAPREEDINFKRTETPFKGNSFEYSLLKRTIEELKLSIRDVCVFFTIPSLLRLHSKLSYAKRRTYMQSIAEECKENLFDLLFDLPEDCIIVPVGDLPNKILLNLKNITDKSGTLKFRNFTKRCKVPDDKGKIKEKNVTKKFQIVPLINPQSIAINQMKYLKIYEKSVRYLYKLLNKEEREEINYKILHKDELDDFVEQLRKDKESGKVKFIYFDIESTSLLYHEVKTLGISLTADAYDTSYYIPILLNEYKDENGNIVHYTEHDKFYIKNKIREILQMFPIVGHNIKYDIVSLMMDNIIRYQDVKIYNDTLLMAHLKYNNTLTSLSLKELSKIFFDVFDDWDKPIDDYRSQYAKENKMKKSEVSYAVVPTNILGKYACYDVYYTKLLYNKLIKELNEEELEHNKRLVEEEQAVIWWEYNGVKIDENKFKKLKEIVIEKVEKAKRKLKELPTVIELYGNKFNPNSTQHISNLAKAYNLPILRKTKAGNISLDKNTLPLYLNRDDISEEAKLFCEYLLDYKFYNKALTSYINSIPKEMDENYIFRTSFNICGTVSGRISSAFHTIPAKTEFGKNFKRMIRSRWRDGIIVSLDVSQAEPRVMASLSGDENLIHIYQEGKDIYKYIATKVYGYDYDEVPKEVRNNMKALVLALMYGMSYVTFAEKTGISETEAEEIFNQFFKEFKGVARFIKEMHNRVFKYKGIKTPFGRFIPISVYNSEEAKRKAQNYIIQSTASELCLDCFKDVTMHLINKKMKSRVVGSVHDSIIIDTKPEEMFEVLKVLKFYVEQKPRMKHKWLKVPIKTDMAIGVSWGNSVEIKEWNKNELIVEGYSQDLNDLLEILQNYDLIECEVLDEEEVEVPDDSLITENVVGKYKLIF